MVELAPAATTDLVNDRKPRLARIYQTLPRYASAAYWRALAASSMPLEVLAHCVRLAQARGDQEGRNRIMEIIVQRTQTSNEMWARYILHHVGIPPGECATLADDLYADLCEHMIWALLDPQRSFWEENFVQCMLFERKHVFHALLVREGHARHPGSKVGLRIPRSSFYTLEQAILQEEQSSTASEDERLQAVLRSIELEDLCALVLALPERFKALLLLIFWEGRTEKEVAGMLGVTDRTVRNRLRAALNILRDTLVRKEARP